MTENIYERDFKDAELVLRDKKTGKEMVIEKTAYMAILEGFEEIEDGEIQMSLISRFFPSSEEKECGIPAETIMLIELICAEMLEAMGEDIEEHIDAMEKEKLKAYIKEFMKEELLEMAQVQAMKEDLEPDKIIN